MGNMPDYQELLKMQRDKQLGTTITGIIARRPTAGFRGPKGCIPILWCWCVHDSPDSPCPCDGPIIWIPEINIIRRVDEKKGSDGRVRTVFHLAPKARLFVDDFQRVNGRGSTGARALVQNKDGEFEKAPGEVWLQELIPVSAGALTYGLELIARDERLSTIAKDNGKAVLRKLLVAFEFGWAIGEAIDEGTGLSDKISDWMLDTFGPWPF